MGMFDIFADSFKISSPIEAHILGMDKEGKKMPYSDKLARKEINQGTAYLKAAETLYPRTLDLMKMAGEGFGDLYRTEADKSREHELGTFQKFGPDYVKAIEAADPMNAELRRRANQYVMERYDAPLSPGMRREIEQSSRALQSLRGFGVRSPADAVSELYSVGEKGHAMEQENFFNSLQLMGANQQAVGDPFMAVVGRPSQPQGSNVMSPQYGDFNNDLFSYGVNREIQSRNMNAAKSAQKMQLVGSAIEGLTGMAGGAMALCWIAREVYGVENPRWMKFRQWMYDHAPAEMLNWYWEHGRAAARYIADKPAVRERIRRWMDAAVLRTATAPEAQAAAA
jgi:hypothetical protein